MALWQVETIKKIIGWDIKHGSNNVSGWIWD